MVGLMITLRDGWERSTALACVIMLTDNHASTLGN